jgi:hypothetical protein
MLALLWQWRSWSWLPFISKLIITSQREDDIIRAFSYVCHESIPLLSDESVGIESCDNIHLFLKARFAHIAEGYLCLAHGWAPCSSRSSQGEQPDCLSGQAQWQNLLTEVNPKSSWDIFKKAVSKMVTWLSSIHRFSGSLLEDQAKLSAKHSVLLLVWSSSWRPLYVAQIIYACYL